MTREYFPKRLIPDYMPDPNAPAVEPVRTRPYSAEQSLHDRAHAWAKWSLAELLAYQNMILGKPGFSDLKMQLIHAIIARKQLMGLAR